MLTGQRVEEIARLHKDQWNAAERIIDGFDVTQVGLCRLRRLCRLCG